jgi:prepilin peptidase dependent protein B
MKKQSGYTLIEIMIALILGLIVVAATISIYISTVGSNSSIIKSARLNHDLEAVMTLMINDIKRSGYWAGATVAADSRVNPFTAASTNVQIHGGDCILYTYDGDDGDGVVDNNEYYGFRLDGTTIKMRKTGTTTDAAGCGTTDQEWEEFIEGSQLTITALQFSFAPITTVTPNLNAASRCLNVTTSTVTDNVACTPTASGNNLAEKRVLNIVLAGRLSSDNSVTKSLNSTVEIRNSRLRLVP